MMAAKISKTGRLEKPTGSDGRASPDTRCVICLGEMQDKSFTDICLHKFCFVCLVKWSKVKAECPLCKQPFKSIIHNVRSNEDYDQYHVPREEPSVVLTNIMSYRFMVDVINSSAAREYFTEFAYLLENPNAVDQLPSISRPTSINVESTLPVSRWQRTSRRTRALNFRASIYRRQLWARPLADVTGVFRECSVNFYRENPAQLTRLAPFIQREVDALFPNSASRANTVFMRTMNAVRDVDMFSSEFRSYVGPLLGEYTDQFLHELQTFARSPYDMIGYDAHADYSPRLQRVNRSRQGVRWAPSDTIIIDPDSDIEVLEVAERPQPEVAPAQSPIVLSDTPVDSDSDVIILSDGPMPRPRPEVLVIQPNEEPTAGPSRRFYPLPMPAIHPTISVKRRARSSSSEDSHQFTEELARSTRRRRRNSGSSRTTPRPSRRARLIERPLSISSTLSDISSTDDERLCDSVDTRRISLMMAQNSSRSQDSMDEGKRSGLVDTRRIPVARPSQSSSRSKGSRVDTRRSAVTRPTTVQCSSRSRDSSIDEDVRSGLVDTRWLPVQSSSRSERVDTRRIAAVKPCRVSLRRSDSFSSSDDERLSSRVDTKRSGVAKPAPVQSSSRRSDSLSSTDDEELGGRVDTRPGQWSSRSPLKRKSAKDSGPKKHKRRRKRSSSGSSTICSRSERKNSCRVRKRKLASSSSDSDSLATIARRTKAQILTQDSDSA